MRKRILVGLTLVCAVMALGQVNPLPFDSARLAPGGTTGQYLRKTADSQEWATVATTTIGAGDLNLATGTSSWTANSLHTFSPNHLSFQVRVQGASTALINAGGGIDQAVILVAGLSSTGSGESQRWTFPRLQTTAGTARWSYIAASDNPAYFARRTVDGEIQSIWISEDPLGERPPIALPVGYVGTDTVVGVADIPQGLVNSLYAAATPTVRAAARASFATDIARRTHYGSPSANSEIQIATNVVEPMRRAARLHAIRALAAASGAMSDGHFIMEKLRIDAAGVWRLAP